MQYKGSASLPQFPRVNAKGKTVAARIEASFREDAKSAFYGAAIDALTGLAELVPVISGSTRRAVLDVRARVGEEYSHVVGGSYPMDSVGIGLTLRKTSQGGAPAEGDKKYKGRWETDTSTGSYGSRYEWSTVEPLKTAMIAVFGSASGTGPYSGTYTLSWDMSLPHWDEYDEGQWHMGDWYDREVASLLAQRLPSLVEGFASIFLEGEMYSNPMKPIRAGERSHQSAMQIDAFGDEPNHDDEAPF